MMRTFHRFCGRGANPEVVRLLAMHAHRLCEKYEINTHTRWCHFAAQWAYLTDGLRNVRMGSQGDYAPRGLLATTGKGSYEMIASDLGENIIEFPAKLGQPMLAIESAFAEWKRLGLNEIADRDDLEDVTRVLDADMSDMGARMAWLVRARGAWPDPARIAMASADTFHSSESFAVVSLLRLLALMGVSLVLMGFALGILDANDGRLGGEHVDKFRTYATWFTAIVGAMVVLTAAAACHQSANAYRRGFWRP